MFFLFFKETISIMNIIHSSEPLTIEKYFPLFESTGWNVNYKLTPEELNSVVLKSYFTVSAHSGETLVGFGRIVCDGILHAIIYEMIIHSDYQLKGIGSEILKMLLKKCKDDNIRDIQLFCAKGKRVFY